MTRKDAVRWGFGLSLLATLACSSARAVLVELNAAERTQVKPILKLVDSVYALKKFSSSAFICNVEFGGNRSVIRDTDGRVRLLGYTYRSPNARGTDTRLSYFDAAGQLKLLQYYSSGSGLLGVQQSEVWEVYFLKGGPLLKTAREGKLWNTLKPLKGLERDPAQAARRTVAQDCARLYPAP